MTTARTQTKHCRPKVYITRQIPQTGLDMLLGRCNVSFWDGSEPVSKTELLVNVPGCSVLLCMPTDKIDRDVLNAAGPSLKIVATMSEDANHIDTSECSRRNIRLLTLPQVTIETLTQMVIAQLRIITNKWTSGSSSNLNLVIQSKDVIKTIKNDLEYCQELSNRTVGIVGMGSLGLYVAKTVRDLGVSSILYHDTEPVKNAEDISATFVDREKLLTGSDIIFVCSNMDSTGKKPYCMFNKEAFQMMKSSAILIDATKRFFANFSDLYDALRVGEIGAVGLDVREYDDIPNRHPLDVLENCFFLPFRECYKWDGRRKCSEELAKSILTTLQEIEFAKKQNAVKKDKRETISSTLSIHT